MGSFTRGRADEADNDDFARLHDRARLQAVRDSALMHGEHPTLDRLTRAAARHLHTPRAQVSVVDADRQVFASHVGLPEHVAAIGETPLSHSFCRHVVTADAPLIVSDARTDRRVQGNPAITDGVIAYAGYPLRSPGHHILGSFCVIDDKPREWTPEELMLLQDLASAAETDIALRLSVDELAAAGERLHAVLDTAQDAFVSIDDLGVVTAWNAAAERLFGYPAHEALGRTVAALIIPERFHDAHAAGLVRLHTGCPSTLAGRRIELPARDRDGREFPVEMSLQMLREHDQTVFHAFLHDISERTATQRALEDERLFLQRLLDSLDAGVAACDAQGRLNLFNRAMREIHHADALPLGTTQWTSTYHLYAPDGRTPLPAEHAPLARAYAGEHVSRQEIVVIPPGAPARRFLTNAGPVDAADGRRLGAVAVLHDITEQHRHETLQRAQLAVADVLAAAADTAQAAHGTLAAVASTLGWTCGEFWQVHATVIERVGSWTAPGQDLSAVTGDEPFALSRGQGLAGTVWDSGAELWVPEVADDERTVARREQCRRAGLHTAIGLPVRSDTQVLGVLLFFSTTVDQPDPELMSMLDGVCAHLGRYIERRRAEKLALQLTAARRHLNRVVTRINDYVWTLEVLPDGTRRTIYTSPDARAILGEALPEDTDPATAMAQRVDPEHRELLTAFQRALADGETADVEVRVRGMDGISRWIWTRGVPRREGEHVYIDAISTNTTDRRELTEQRDQLLADQQEQNRQLRDLDRMKDELVALVSHELRNPLAVIRTHGEILLDDPELTADLHHLASAIDKHSAHMQHLVDDLLDMARLDAGQLSLDRRPLSLSRLIRDSAEALRPSAEAKHLTVALDVPLHLTVYADPLRLRQVIDNLLSNAVKYTPDAGSITIIAASRGPDVLIRIGDTGIGVPADQYPHLFDRFFRATNAVAQGIKGTGLGLAISKAIIEAHDGTITARPEHGGGTVFTITLPAP